MLFFHCLPNVRKKVKGLGESKVISEESASLILLRWYISVQVLLWIAMNLTVLCLQSSPEMYVHLQLYKE